MQFLARARRVEIKETTQVRLFEKLFKLHAGHTFALSLYVGRMFSERRIGSQV